jgi:UDP-N-acetylglucosamine--N-acetylmuramyl-(pentapeptide) pyrophosphoryl-undecaprenol N-acetylglucosamine transferase
MKKSKKIVITGGHHNSALVVAQSLRQKGHQVFWFGHRFTMLGDRQPGAEYQEVTAAGFKFIEITPAKISRKQKLVYLSRLPLGFIQSFYHLLKIRPQLILSFGGYLAVPVVICGSFLGIPIITHEQTVTSGWANRLISRLARKILISWQTSLKHFPRSKTVFTGLPLRREIFSCQEKIDFSTQLPTIYITGGKQGSHLINRTVEKALPRLLAKFNLIHQTGGSSLHNDYARLKEAKKKLPTSYQKRYLIKDYFPLQEIGSVFSASDLVVGRSGAHITYELAALGQPSLLIPIPWSRANEQTKNAQVLVKAGLAEILPQEKLSSQNLINLIEKMVRRLKDYQKHALKAKKLVKLGAASQIVALVENL